MKKKLSIFLVLFAIICFSIPAYAKDETVTISSAEATKTIAKVKGNTDALAVTIQLRDSSNNIISMITEGTTLGAFEAEFSSLSLTPGTYTVYVADYEGGTWTTKDIKVTNKEDDRDEGTKGNEPETVAPKDDYTNVPAGAGNPLGLILIVGVGLVAAFGMAFLLLKRQEQK